jgi:GNAT superfamily N-acetyltransferase
VDWRIQCFYVDRRHRGQGVARAALEGAVEQIAGLGGGPVETISGVSTGRRAHGRFLFSATVEPSLHAAASGESLSRPGKLGLPPAPSSDTMSGCGEHLD